MVAKKMGRGEGGLASLSPDSATYEVLLKQHVERSIPWMAQLVKSPC